MLFVIFCLWLCCNVLLFYLIFPFAAALQCLFSACTSGVPPLPRGPYVDTKSEGRGNYKPTKAGISPSPPFKFPPKNRFLILPHPFCPLWKWWLFIFSAPAFIFTKINVELLLRSMQCVLVYVAARISYPQPLLLRKNCPSAGARPDLLAQI